MEDPETEAETGTAEEETAAETTEAEVETPADDSADDQSEGNGESKQQADTRVPYDRFKAVNEQRKAAEAKAAELQAKLDAQSPKPEKVVGPKERLKGLKPADPTMTPLEQMEHYTLAALDQHPEIIDSWFERKFGMPAEAAAATLAQARPRVQQDIRREFEEACKAHDLDPNNKIVQHMVGTAMDSGLAKTFSEAMDAVVKPKKNGTTQAQPRRVNGAESESVDVSGLTSVTKTFLSKDEAAQLASQGKRVKHMSVVDLLMESSKAQ